LCVVVALLAAVGCHKSSRRPAPVVTTNNLTASVMQIASGQPRVGYPLEVVTAIQATEATADVSVSYFALNAEDVANQADQVRQFVLGTVTFPLVQPSIAQYRAKLTVPTSVTPPGDYVILCSIDPSNLVAETDEKDNVAQVATTITPVQEPNLLLRQLDLDAASLLLDADVDDVAGGDPGDVQNADLGATLAIGLEGTLSDVQVEAAVKLRIIRTDKPAGQDRHDIPLYLWDSDAQRYIDVFGIHGPVEWLPLGAISPERVTETNDKVAVDAPGAKSVHLDVYLPGKLASVMITILENLVQGPPPTQPPPDLRLEDIQALQDFFSGARMSTVRYEFVAEVRAAGGQFVDSNATDNAASQPFYVVLPGQESYAPDRPIAFSEGIDAGWKNSKFGVGFEFDSYASLDERGAVAGVRGGVPATIFGSSFDFMSFDGRAQVVPEVDPAQVPAGEGSSFALDLEFLSLTVYSYQEQLGYAFDGTFSIVKEKRISARFWVGPVPLSVSGGAGGEIGYQLTIDLQPTVLESGLHPFASLEASIEAGVGIAGFLQAGAGGSLTLIEERFGGTVRTELAVVSFGPQPAIFQGTLDMRVTNTVTGPVGSLYLFVEYPSIKWCWYVIPCGFKIARNTLTLVTWHSFVKEDVLFDETLCKRVTIGTGVAFSGCVTP
jgi:hypothetical protein